MGLCPAAIAVGISRTQVLYVAVRSDPGLTELQRRLSDRLLAVGAVLPDTRPFVPHCTIAKLTGRLSNDFHSIDPSLYAAFRSITFGDQQVWGGAARNTDRVTSVWIGSYCESRTTLVCCQCVLVLQRV